MAANYLLCWGKQPHLFEWNEKGERPDQPCPECGENLGLAPSRINGKEINPTDLISLRLGDEATLAKYYAN